MASLAACGNMVIWAIDLKQGVELRPWAPCLDRLATTPAEAAALLADAVAILFPALSGSQTTASAGGNPHPPSRPI